MQNLATKEKPNLDLKQRLQNHLAEIVRDRDPYLSPIGHLYVQQYIRAQLQQWGTVETYEFTVNGKKHQNLILNLPASELKYPPILIGAHYDGVPGSPAADDNGTGVAALLELARNFAAEPIKYPVRIVAFDLEEYGLLGSQAYANFLKQQGQHLRLMISLEMLGYCDDSPNSQRYPTGLEYFYPDRGNFIALIGNLTALPDLMKLRGNIRQSGTKCEFLPVPNQGKMVRATRLSDHAPFWDNGYRAMMITDTAFMRNPHYHQASDRIETLNLDFLAGVCRGLESGLRKL